MPTSFPLDLIFITFGFFVVLWFVHRKINKISEQNKTSNEIVEWLKSTAEQSRNINERLDNAANVIMNVQRSLGEMNEIGRSMKDLQDLLRSPKLRGNVGEQVLKELLGQMLPKQSFHLQYSFKSGAIVDAAIVTSGGVIPVDSKFPMENFRKMNQAQTEQEKKAYERDFFRDVKAHIDTISRKYILTDEGTVDYALMYIPSEAVYYEIMCGDGDLVDYAHTKRVLPVSPTTFYAYLRAILMSFEGQKIEAQAREILSAIRAIGKDYSRVEENLGILGKHLTNAFNMMGNVNTSFLQLGQKITSTQRLSSETKEEIKQLNMDN